MVKNSSANAVDLGFDPWIGKILCRRKWQPTPGFLPGESHEQRSLVDYTPWGQKESDTTEQLNNNNERVTHTHTHTHTRAVSYKTSSGLGNNLFLG